MKSVQCPICSSKDSTMYMKGMKDLLHKCKGEWNLARCSQCNTIYTSPPLKNDELGQFYPSEYTPYNIMSKNRNIFFRFFRSILKSPYVIRFGSPNRSVYAYGNRMLLDIGCGSGVYLNSMNNFGWKCWGIDISEAASKKAKSQVPSAHVENTSLEEFETDELFTLVSFNHVLEHVPDPLGAIRKVYKLLEPGGRVEIEVPNIASFEAKLFGKKWVGLDVPRHITHFTSETITSLLQSNGFIDIRIKPAMFSSLISESLILCLPEKYSTKVMGSRWSRIIYFLCIFPASLSYFFGNEGVIMIKASKPG